MKIKADIDFETVADHMTHEQSLQAVEVLLDSMTSYGFDNDVFELVMSKFIATADDASAEADIKLGIDEMITDAVDRFREALHG